MHRKLILLVALSMMASVICATASFAVDDNWPMFKQNSLRTGVDVLDSTLGTTSVSGGTRPVPVWVFPQLPIDNGDSSFSLAAPGTSDPWSGSSSVSGEFATGAINSDYAWVLAKYSATAKWETWTESQAIWSFYLTTGTSGGAYYAEVWFPSYMAISSGAEAGLQHTTDAHYIVTVDGTVVGRYTVDQTTGGQWVTLGGSSINIPSGSHTVNIMVTNESQKNTLPRPIVVADAARLVPFESGMVVSSSVIARRYSGGTMHPVAVSGVTTTKLLPTSSGQDSSTTCAEIYGIYTESYGDNATTVPDQRAGEAWRFPNTPTHNWIGGGISSTPTIVDAVGTNPELAIIPCMDGQVYAIKTSDGSWFWQGPGHYIWDPTSTNQIIKAGDTTEPNPVSLTATWSAGTHAGYQQNPAPAGSDTYLTTPAVSGSPTGTALWTATSIPDGTYSIYAWIPPSVGGDQQYIVDATYEVLWNGGTKSSYKVNQANGGRWAKICELPHLTAAQLSVLKIELLNSTSNLSADGSSYVAADAIRIVPSDMAAFDRSSALTYYDTTSSTLKAYVGNTNGRLYALNIDKDSPDPDWVYPGKSSSGVNLPALGVMYASPTFDDATNPSTIYIGTTDGHVYAVSRTTGSALWKYPLTGNDTDNKYYSLGKISSTSVLGKYLYVSTCGSTGYGFTFNPCGRVVALDTTPDVDPAHPRGTSAANPGSGRDQWWYPATTSAAAGSFIYSSPLSINLNTTPSTPALVAGSTDGTLYELNPSSGAALNATLPGFNTGSTSNPFTNVSGEIYSSPAGWRSMYPDVNSGPMNCEVAYFGSGNFSSNTGQLYGVNLLTGAKDWWVDLPGAVVSSPALHNGRIYAGDTDGYLWAFATNAGEGWSLNAGTQPTISSSEGGSNPRTSWGEVEIYNKTQFQAIMKAIYDSQTNTASIDSTYDDLHSVFSTDTTYEWGEKFYVIAWNLLNPNYIRATKTYSPIGSAGYKAATDSTVSLIFKTHDSGDNSDADITQTMISGDYEFATGQKVPRQGYFMDKDGNAVFYSIGTLDVDGRASGWLPGKSISITLRERPANSNDVGSDVCVTDLRPIPTVVDNGITKNDHAKYTERYITVNNPLGLAYGNWHIGIDADFTHTSKSSPWAGTNGNADSIPIVQPGLNVANDAIIPHGTTSLPEVVTVCDRSLLGQSGLASTTLNSVKAEPVDVEWAGGQAAIVAADGGPSGAGTSPSTYLPWEVLPNELPGQANASPDYPDISASRYSCVQDGTAMDVTVGSLGLPATPSPVGTSPWISGQAGVDFSLSVPQFQPANYDGVVPGLPTNGYVGKAYIYLDINGDNHLQKSGTLGLDSLKQKTTGASAEPYRELFFNARVPMDRRVQIDEASIDLGTVPQGFGLSSMAGDGTPIPFDGPSLTLASLWTSSPWAPFFKPFTAHNLGNVNMINLKVANKVYKNVNGSGVLQDLYLNSDTVNDNPLTSSAPVFGLDARGFEDYSNSTYAYPWLTTSADTRFAAQTHPAGYGVTFQKPVIGSQGRTLNVPEVNSGLNNPNPPLLSLAVPVGQPVGTYTGTFTIYEDASPDHVNLYDEVTPALSGGAAIDYAGDPVLKVSVTVGEAQITGKTATVGTGNSAPQLDNASTANQTGANMFPAAWVDPTNGYTYLFMSSDRGTAALLSAPWYLWGTHLTTVGKPVNGYEAVFGSTSGSQDTSWMRQPSSFPDPALVSETATGSLFPKSSQSPGVSKADSARFMYPSGAVDIYIDPTTGNQDPSKSRAWLFFTGQVTKSLSGNPDVYVQGGTKNNQSLSGTGAETTENRAFVTEVTGGNPLAIEPISSDWGSAKYGLRGMATRLGPEPILLSKDDLYLWGWWYGGGNNKWRIFYNYRDLSDSADGWGGTGSITSHDVAQLPMLPGLTSVAEPSPIFHKSLGGRLDVMDVLYSGFSSFHKTSDIYLTRYDVSPTSKTNLQAISKGDVKTVSALPLPAIVGETLSRAASTTTWWSQHVDWDTTAGANLMIQYVDNGGSTKILNLTGTLDPTSGMMMFVDTSTNTTNTTVAADTVTGSVKMVRMPKDIGNTPSLVLRLDYVPKSYRLTSGPGTNVSPFALLDKDPNPRYTVGTTAGPMSPTAANPFQVPSGWSGAPKRDRLWLFWRKAGDAKSGAGVVYKTFRYTAQLNYQLGALSLPTVSVLQVNSPVNTPVNTPIEVDWMKNRLYFVSDEDGKQMVVSYTDKDGVSRSDTLTVELTEEPIIETKQEVQTDTASRQAYYLSQGKSLTSGPTAAGPLANVTRVMVNEGQVSAVKDPREDKVWVFWSSTRSGSTDIFYEVISPKFYGTETNL